MIPNIDISFINDLLQTFHDPIEGSMFSATGESRVNIKGETFARLDFLSMILTHRIPKKILEIGTHKAEFCYLAKLCVPSLKSIVTICSLEESKKCVDLVNSYFSESFIEFHHGQSLDIWNSNILMGNEYDMGYVDGGHTPGDLNKNTWAVTERGAEESVL